MLYGNIIFIKKTGGDGSKFPVTERNIKIGRSEDCLIRIHNPQVALEHCQLIIEENGQATLRNLSDQTVLNGKPLGHKDVVLCHGDVFKLGERLARWEYLPTSKYYRQLLSPTGRLVAVVMPQQRPLEKLSTPRASTSQVTVLKSTPLGKRRYSERATSESSVGVKVRKSNVADSVHKSRVDLSKFLTGRHSLKTSKLVLQGSKAKDRKSMSGRISSKSPRVKVEGKLRKSTMPTWKVNIVTPPEKKSGEDSVKKLNRKSVKSPKSAIKTPSKDVIKSGGSKKYSSVTKTKTPQKGRASTVSPEKVLTSASKGTLKTPLKTTAESSPKSKRGSSRSSLSRKSSKKSLLKSPSNIILSTPSSSFHGSVFSEKKSSSKRSTLPRGSKKMTPMLESLKSETVLASAVSSRKSIKNSPAQKAVIGSEKKVKSSVKKNSKSAQKIENVQALSQNPVINVPDSFIVEESIKSKRKLNFNRTLEDASQTNLNKFASPKSAGNTPLKKMAASSEKNIRKSRTPSRTRKTPSKTDISSGEISKIVSPRGSQRKLSPSSSAEIAAKKLKTSSPKKPDKNKKAALLVLGKANRKHLMAQNVKILLKQKIVKKALKLSSSASGEKVEKKKTTGDKLKRGRKEKTKTKTKKPRKSTSAKKSNEKSTSKASDASALSFPAKNVTQEDTPKSKNSLEVTQTPSRFSSISKPAEAISKSPNQKKKTESPTQNDNLSAERGRSAFSEITSPFNNFGKNAENYLLTSFRRCSKRLSSKNDTGRPDFVELSPTALGLMPKNLEIFKTPKDYKRRSSSLTTPKTAPTTGIIKSASTTKISKRKSVRFSPKKLPINSSLSSPNFSDKPEFDFSSFHTPDITMDVFVSPLSEKNSTTKNAFNESELFVNEVSKSFKNRGTNSESKVSVRKSLQSPQSEKSLDLISFDQKIVSRNSKTPLMNSNSPVKLLSENKSPEHCSVNLEDVRQMFETPKTQKSPKNKLSDSKGVSNLIRTSKVLNSPKNEQTDLMEAKKLQTFKTQKSPKNDLTDVRGVKKLLRTPRVQKSPKNDLTDVRGVKRLLKTPKVQKSPKNDLTDVRGVKKLLGTPKVQKSPKNDLTNIRGVKKLLRTPKVQKSPKNDLTDVRGVRKLLATPKVQKSPKNDLTDVRGVKKLLRTPKVQKSPKNDLTDVRGVKKLLATPKLQKSPKNDLTDVRGVKKLLATPKTQKSPKNDLSDVRGVKKLLKTPKVQKSPKNELSDLTGVKELLESPKRQESLGMGNISESPAKQKLSRNSIKSSSSQQLIKPLNSEENYSENVIDITEVNISKDKKTVPRKSRVKDYKAIRGRRTINACPKGPKNDLSDVLGVRELFLRHQPPSDYSDNLTGIAELFNLSESDVAPKRRAARSTKITKLETSETRPLRRRRVLEVEAGQDESMKTRGIKSRKASKETEKTAIRNTKRKAVEKVKTSSAKKVSVDVKQSRTPRKPRTESAKRGDDGTDIKSSRKRKASVVNPESPPPKLGRTLRGGRTLAKDTPVESSVTFSGGSDSEDKSSAKRGRKISTKTTNKKSEVSPKVQIRKTAGTKKTQKVQTKRSQSKTKNAPESGEKISPRKTRSAKTTTKKVSGKSPTPVKTTSRAAGKKKLSSVTERATRRKAK